jgi:FKBP-type peptidyl-prolyl cis-trans isomerase SlyD
MISLEPLGSPLAFVPSFPGYSFFFIFFPRRISLMIVQLLARVVCYSVLLLGTSFSLVLAEAQEGVSPIIISDGKTISMEYTLTLEDKKVLDTNVGDAPLNFTQGSHQIIPGLEAALEGMKVGETKQVMVDPEQGYGAINPKAIQEVPIEKIPEEARKVGIQLQGKDAQGRMVQARVSEVKEQVVMLDYNHPLAGKNSFLM